VSTRCPQRPRLGDYHSIWCAVFPRQTLSRFLAPVLIEAKPLNDDSPRPGCRDARYDGVTAPRLMAATTAARWALPPLAISIAQFPWPWPARTVTIPRRTGRTHPRGRAGRLQGSPRGPGRRLRAYRIRPEHPRLGDDEPAGRGWRSSDEPRGAVARFCPDSQPRRLGHDQKPLRWGRRDIPAGVARPLPSCSRASRRNGAQAKQTISRGPWSTAPASGHLRVCSRMTG